MPESTISPSQGTNNSASGSILSPVLLVRGWRGDITRVEGVDRVKWGGRASSPSPGWPVMTECTQESGHSQSTYSFVCERHTGRLRIRDNLLMGGGGRSQNIWRRECLVLYKSFNTRCCWNLIDWPESRFDEKCSNESLLVKKVMFAFAFALRFH